jgi:hypothetical protein
MQRHDFEIEECVSSEPISDDGIAETRTIFLPGLNSPFGMALTGNDF